MRLLRVSSGFFIVLLLACMACASTAVGADYEPIPMPQGAPEGATYKTPELLPDRTGGPFVPLTTVVDLSKTVAKAKQCEAPAIESVVLTTHGRLSENSIFSPSYSVAPGREVYLVTMKGHFEFIRARKGSQPIVSDYATLEIDATSGQLLAVGTGQRVQGSELIDRLKLNADSLWTGP